MKKSSQLEVALSYGAIILLLFGAFFLNSTPEPKTYQEILNQATGHRPIMGNGYNNFYSFLRIYIFSVSLYLIYLNYPIRRMGIIYGFILIGIIFNPVLLLSLDIKTWKILDFFTSLFFAYYLFSIHRSSKKIIMEREAAERREKIDRQIAEEDKMIDEYEKRYAEKELAIGLSPKNEYDSQFKQSPAVIYYNKNDLQKSPENIVDLWDLMDAGNVAVYSEIENKIISEIKREVFDTDFERRIRYYLPDGTCFIDMKTMSKTP